jgi:CheY-like chemotaxis protein
MKKSIYLVEDDKEIRELIQLVLEPLNVEISFFETVSDFKKQFGVWKPDLLVLDVMLPDGSGMEICESVKSCLRLNRTGSVPRHAMRMALLQSRLTLCIFRIPFSVRSPDAGRLNRNVPY